MQQISLQMYLNAYINQSCEYFQVHELYSASHTVSQNGTPHTMQGSGYVDHSRPPTPEVFITTLDKTCFQALKDTNKAK